MSLVKKYKAQIVKIAHPLPDIYTVYFKSPDKQFKYKPGQFLHLTLSEYDPSQQWPESRCFSMQSSPEEELLMITYSVKGEYTRRMESELKEGGYVWLKLPYGEMFQKPHSKVNGIFIAGGTGVTPYLSLFTDSSFKQYDNAKAYLGFRSEEYNIYAQALEKAVDINKSFSPYTVYQDKDGLLDIKKILESSDTGSTFFISGPPVMLKIFKKYLTENDVPGSLIITDDWE
jgi:NAD(P)H-flavin reductase